MCGTKEVGVLWISAQRSLCGIMLSRDVPLFHPSHSLPSTQAIIDSVYYQPYRGMDLDIALKRVHEQPNL
jgi:hypothetical protein